MNNILQKDAFKILLLFIVVLCTFYLFTNRSITYVHTYVFTQNVSKPQIRIYCLILTSPKYFDTRARAVNQTWGPRCDKYSFISEYSNDTQYLPIAPIANISSGYGHLTQKSTLAFQYVYENYFNDFDWFVKADDDTYLFVENLKSFLKEQNSSDPVTFGYNFRVRVFKGTDRISIKLLIYLDNRVKRLSFWWWRICFKS